MTNPEVAAKAILDYGLEESHAQAVGLLGPDLVVFVDEPMNEASWKLRVDMVEGWQKFPHNAVLRAIVQKLSRPASELKGQGAFWLVVNQSSDKPFVCAAVNWPPVN